jgi:hypothetical protein
MNILKAIQMGMKAQTFISQLQGAAPEMVDVLNKGQETVKHALSIYDDGKMTVKEREKAAKNIQAFGKEMADVIRLLPAVNEN